MKTELCRQLDKVLSKVRYGNVTLIIHDSKIVRIEVVEKIRLESTPMELSKENDEAVEEDHSKNESFLENS